jgi:ectoine hydroxylase-related dioxygenase (phytanoyl-CoA dioxygenase family)
MSGRRPGPVRALSAEEAQRFAEDGFVLVKRALDEFAIDAIRAELDRLEAVPEAPGQHWVYGEMVEDPEPRRIIARMENLDAHSPVIAALNAALCAHAATVFGQPAVLFKDKVNFKRPGGAGFTPHQDQQAGWWNYASRFVSIMVSIDAATIANGCVEFAAGHHTRGMFREWEPLTDEDMRAMRFVPVETEPGDVVLIDSFTPHRSEPNRTDRQRRLYFATFNPAAEGDHLTRYYADKHANYPPDVERDSERSYRFRV